MNIRGMIKRHWVVTLLIMVLSAVVFGLSTYNLFFLLRANLEYIGQNGWMGLRDGGLQQLGELALNGLIGVVFYIVFKACEKVLVEALLK
jgi:hypothetical protein